MIIFDKSGHKKELQKDRKDRIAKQIIAHILKSTNKQKVIINS